MAPVMARRSSAFWSTATIRQQRDAVRAQRNDTPTPSQAVQI
jgi:hypothetical protein